MDKKSEFVSLFEKAVGKHPETFKDKPNKLANILNNNPKLLEAWNEALEEADTPAAGLGLLFPGLGS